MARVWLVFYRTARDPRDMKRKKDSFGAAVLG
jgi:hypothetical protein